jgi:hypothetical protein
MFTFGNKLFPIGNWMTSVEDRGFHYIFSGSFFILNILYFLLSGILGIAIIYITVNYVYFPNKK